MNGTTIPSAVPYKPHRPTPSSSSYNTTPILALHSGCKGRRAHGSRLTHLSFRSLGFQCPSYQACLKTCSEGCYIHSVWHPAQTDEESCVRERCSQGQKRWFEIWSVGSLERLWFCQISPTCMSYTLPCNLPWNETSTSSGQWNMFSPCYLAWNLMVWWVALGKLGEIDIIL